MRISCHDRSHRAHVAGVSRGSETRTDDPTRACEAMGPKLKAEDRTMTWYNVQRDQVVAVAIDTQLGITLPNEGTAA